MVVELHITIKQTELAATVPTAWKQGSPSAKTCEKLVNHVQVEAILNLKAASGTSFPQRVL
jgi:hypothetical protein